MHREHPRNRRERLRAAYIGTHVRVVDRNRLANYGRAEIYKCNTNVIRRACPLASSMVRRPSHCRTLPHVDEELVDGRRCVDGDFVFLGAREKLCLDAYRITR